MAKKIQQTFTNGHNEEHYKIMVVGGGLVKYYLLSYFRDFPLKNFFLPKKNFSVQNILLSVNLL